MDHDKLARYARALARKDLEAEGWVQDKGLTVEDLAAEYEDELRREAEGRDVGEVAALPRTKNGHGHHAPLPKLIRRARAPSKQEPIEAGGSKTLPEAILSVLAATGRPMQRMEVWDMAVKQGWIEDKAAVEDRHKVMGNAIRRLIKKGQLFEMNGPKPRRIALPNAPRLSSQDITKMF